MLAPLEAKTLLGRVRSLVRTPDGTAQALVARTGLLRDLLGLGGPLALVPLDHLALLGDELILVGLTPPQLAALPPPPPTIPVPPGEILRIGLARPSH